jgi:hypothetical protein
VAVRGPRSGRALARSRRPLLRRRSGSGSCLLFGCACLSHGYPGVRPLYGRCRGLSNSLR